MPVEQDSTRRMFARPLVWAGATVLLAALVVQITHTGVDVLALLVALFVLLLIERTLGDWIADSVGPIPAVLIFIAIAALGVTYVSMDRGRARVRRTFVAAEALGYHTAYFSLDEDTEAAMNEARPPSMIDRLPQPTATGAPVAGPVAAAAPPPSAGTSGPAPAPSPVSARPVTPVEGRAPSTAVVPAAAPSAPREPKQAAGVRVTRLSLTPDLATTGQPIVIRAEFRADDDGVLPEVEFSIDGRPIARVRPDVHRVALASWKTMIPGQYAVRVRLSGSLLGAPIASATLNVLPGRQ